ncbi:condensin complex subunit 3 [Pseudohyphozyma bogoriensis]|nr:condensin complex subunit 3 [Pseudohyphozyma bogoriensis]
MPGLSKQQKQAAASDPSKLVAPIAALFAATQHTLASHRKNINALHAVFLACAAYTTLSDDGESLRLTGEKAFGDAIRDATARVLVVKKGVEQGDRVVKFLAGFVAFAVEYDEKKRQEAAAARGDDEEDEDEEEDGPSTRLVSQLLAFLLKGFLAKNKVVRFRAVQLVALLINSLGEIDDESYQNLKAALLNRIRDKESSVRMQAVVALSKLQGADDSGSEGGAEDGDDSEEEPEKDSDDEDLREDSDEEYEEKKPVKKGSKKEIEKEAKVAEVLMDVLSYDAASEVRRATLLNLLPTPSTLPLLLQRTLDVDPINRRAAFSHVLPEVPVDSYTRAQRAELVKRGLDDREGSVKKAAMTLVGRWAVEKGGVLPFVEMFDLENETKVAEMALGAVFETKPELLQSVEFGEEFYDTITPASAFLLRTYIAYLRRTSSPLLDDIAPVVTRLAFLIQSQWTELVVLLENEERDEDAERESLIIVRELIAEAEGADYGDEMGRRAMFDLMRGLLGHASLPASLIPPCLDVLLKGGIQEKDFVRIVVEIVQVLRSDSALLTSESEVDDDDDDDEDLDLDEDSMRERSDKKKQAKRAAKSRGAAELKRRKELDLRCLAVCKALLERVMGAIKGENSMVHGLVLDLIVPAVKSKDHAVRAQGLLCLGLGCLLDKSMALDSFELLARQSQATEGELQVKILQTLFDMLILHGINFGAERGFGPDVILAFLLNNLEQEEHDVAATAVVGIVKLMLYGLVKDEELLSRLVLLYFASETADNQELRQCLSYFFPRYCYENPLNQRRVANVSLTALALLKGVYDDLDDKTTMVAPLQIGLQLVDWTDPQKAFDSEFAEPDETIHFDLAVQMVKLLFTQEQKDERKLLCQLLPKLYIPDEIDELKIKSLLTLIASLKLNRPLADTVSKNALVRFETSLTKAFGEKLDALTEDQIKEAEELKATHDFIRQALDDDEAEEEEDEEEEDEEAGGDEEDEEEGVAESDEE